MLSSEASSLLRLGTRGSLLARTQSMIVATKLENEHPGVRVQLVVIATSGDQISGGPLHSVGGKGLFTRELELALLENQIDFAVHSFKDMPVTMPLVDQGQLVIAAVPPREDARDVLISAGAGQLAELPRGATVGTGSLRRRCQLLDSRPDLSISAIRGNIDTRLAKQAEGEFGAVVLALAGIRRVGLWDSLRMAVLPASQMLSAAGQGALALQCRRGDERVSMLLSALDDPETRACVVAERELVKLLNGDCLSPIAAHATIRSSQLHLESVVGGKGGEPPLLRAMGTSPVGDPIAAAKSAFEVLRGQGVDKLLA